MNKEEFEKKVKVLRPRLIGYANSILNDEEETEDVVQDTLLKLWYINDKVEIYKSLEALSFTILRRLIINIKRKKKVKLPLEESIMVGEPELIEGEEFSDEIKEALQSLPSMEQAVMRMKHIDNMETEEISAIIGSNAGAIRTALSRARKKLRERFISGKK